MHRSVLRTWLVDAGPVLFALWLAWSVVATWWARLYAPFDLEWMEGGILGHAWQLVHGRPVYADPTLDHISFVYPPGYYAVLSAIEPWVGLDYPVGRAISAICSFGTAVVLAVGVRRQGGFWAPGIWAGALYLALYTSSGSFYDLVRPDALGVFLLACAVVLGLERYRYAEVGAGLLLCAAFMVKHNLAAWGLALLPAIWAMRGRAAAIRFVVASAGPALLFTGWLQWVSDGYFLDYLLGVPGSHPMVGWRVFPGTPAEMGRHLLPVLGCGAIYATWRTVREVPGEWLGAPLLLAPSLAAFGWVSEQIPLVRAIPPYLRAASVFFVGLALLMGALRLTHQWRSRTTDWRWIAGVAMALVAFVIGGLMRGHHGGFNNVFMPLHWTLCFGVGVLAGRTRIHLPGLRGVVLTAVLGTGCLAWTSETMGLMRVRPTAADLSAHPKLVQQLRDSCDGRIFSPFHSWLPVQAGQEPTAHLIAIWDLNHAGGPMRPRVAQFKEASAATTWACVVSGGQGPLRHGVDEHYRMSERLTPTNQRALLRAKSGWGSRPEAILVPKSASGQRSGME